MRLKGAGLPRKPFTSQYKVDADLFYRFQGIISRDWAERRRYCFIVHREFRYVSSICLILGRARCSKCFQLTGDTGLTDGEHFHFYFFPTVVVLTYLVQRQLKNR